MKPVLIFITFFLVCIKQIAVSQISITALPYVPGTTNFNGYNPNSLANLNSTIPAGWTASTAGTAVYNGQGNGTSGSAGYWALGTGGEFCLGSVPSGTSDNITYTVSFTNNTGSTITTLAISWDYEQWRFNGNSDMFVTGTGALSANATLNAQDYNDVVGASGTVATTSISIILNGLSITNGTSFGITWVASNTGSGASDNGIGIDNFNIVASRTNPTDHFRTRQNGNWNASSTWESSADAITWVNSNASPDFNANTITVRNGHTATVTSSVSIDQTSINTGGQVTVNGGQTLTILDGAGTDLTVDGTLLNNGAISQTGTATFNAGSLYTHGINGGAIPTATWNTTSTCNVTGVTSTPPTGLNQSFGNFTWNCPFHATLINLNSQLQTINGNFTVLNAGQASGRTTSNGLALSSNTDFTLNIGGNLNIDHTGSSATWVMMTNGIANVVINIGGNFNISKTSVVNNTFTYFDYKVGTGTAMGTLVVNVAGDLTMTGGNLDLAFQASSYTVATELRIAGNLSVSASSSIISSGTNLINGKIIFNKIGTQTIFEGAAGVTAYVNFQVNTGSTTEFLSNFYLYDFTTAIKSGNFVVQAGAVVDMNTFILHGFNVASGQINAINTFTSFILNSTSKIITANPNGVHSIGFINGSISAAIATRVFSSGADYEFQSVRTGTFVTTPTASTARDFIINNSTGDVLLDQTMSLDRTLNFVSGRINIGAFNLTINSTAAITGNTNARYVITVPTSSTNGRLRQNGLSSAARVFPVGTASNYLPVTIIPASTGSDFSINVFRSTTTNGIPGGTAFANRTHQVDALYRIDRADGTSDAQIRFDWQTNTIEGALFTALANNQIGIWVRKANWVLAAGAGSSNYVNDNTANFSHTSGNLTDFGTAGTGYPYIVANIATLPFRFTILDVTKTNNGSANLEWQLDNDANVDYFEVEESADGVTFTKLSKINADGSKLYRYSDPLLNDGANYYRVKAVSKVGEIVYSSIVALNNKLTASLQLLNNPVVSQLVFKHPTAVNAQYRITDLAGRTLMSGRITPNAVITQIDVSKLTSGTYILQFINDGEQIVNQFIRN